MGRTAIYMVMGMTTIFLFFGKTMTDVATESIDNAVVYYENTQRYNIAVAGANLACNQIFLDNTWRDGFTDMDFNGGLINVSLYDSASGKVTVTSTGSYQTETHTVKVLLAPSTFAKFAMYSGNVSSAAKLRTGDTIDGAIHFNNSLSTQGSPVFLEKVTAGSIKTTAGTPKFLGGYQEGVNIPFPDYKPSADAIKAAASSGGFYQSGGELWLNFLSDGTVQYKTSEAGSWSAAQSLSTFAPNGSVCINDGSLHVQGTLNGQLSVASTVTTGTPPSATVGSTYIEGDLKYANDPLTNPASTDMLGLVSAGDLSFETMPIRVDGSLFTDNNATLGSGLPNVTPMEQIKIVGSFISRSISSTDFGTGSGKGANFHMTYDSRIESNPPANFPFPATATFEVLSWYE
ncbi:MAG: hypothetical protein ACYC09_02205 [Bacteroidota bacterium]